MSVVAPRVSAGTRIWIVAGVTDMRRGFDGLSSFVRNTLTENPFFGHVVVFRGRCGDLIKVLWWDGDGLRLLAKRLDSSMEPAGVTLPDLDQLSVEELKTLLIDKHSELLSYRTEVESLKLQLFKLRRMQFGKKSKKRARQQRR